jgi:hypothetical protein
MQLPILACQCFATPRLVRAQILSAHIIGSPCLGVCTHCDPIIAACTRGMWTHVEFGTAGHSCILLPVALHSVGFEQLRAQGGDGLPDVGGDALVRGAS